MIPTPHRRFGVRPLARIFPLLIAGATMTGCGSGDGATSSRELVHSNLVVMRSLVAGLGQSVLDSAVHLPGDTVALDVDSSVASWIARTELAALLGSRGRKVVIGTRGADSAHPIWRVRGLTLGVEYRNIRKDGPFSATVVDRFITAAFTSEVISGGNVIYAGTSSRNTTDTVAEDRIGDLESGSTQIARGVVPDLRSLDRFFEPFVIIGATGAAILLFFQVRS